MIFAPASAVVGSAVMVSVEATFELNVTEALALTAVADADECENVYSTAPNLSAARPTTLQ